MTGQPELADLPDDKEERRKLLSSMILGPSITHGAIAHGLLKPIAGGELDQGEVSLALQKRLIEVRAVKLGTASDMLAAQAFSLDAIYIEMTRRAMLNLGEYPDAADRYMRLAMKAQAQSRATLEALTKMHQPREQTVRHVHVDNRGGQAVIAETVHTGGAGNGKADGQPHAAAIDGVGTALPSPNPVEWALPVASGEGKEAMPNARRPEPGSA